MDFQTDDDLVFGEEFVREGRFGGEFGHVERKSIAEVCRVKRAA